MTGDLPLHSVVVLAVALAACSKHRAPGAGPSASASAVAVVSARPVVTGLRLVTPTAFDLVPSASGATLSFVEAAPRRAVRLELDANGLARGGPVVALDASAMSGEPWDLASARVGERLALAWLERDGPKARVRAAWARAEGVNSATPPKVLELGSAWAGPRNARGNLVVAARGDRALVFARGEQAACVDPGQKTCFGFSFHELEADRATLTGLPLTVPVPCTDHSATLAVVGERWHYGVCTDTGTAPMTTVFTIERNPEYARADRLLSGCRPKGTVSFGGAAWLVGDCRGSRRAVRVAGREEPLEYLELRTARFECTADGARIRAPGLDLALDEPRGGLEALLPADVAWADSRAVWSGRALVVAGAAGGALGVRRVACAGAEVTEEPVSLGPTP